LIPAWTLVPSSFFRMSTRDFATFIPQRSFSARSELLFLPSITADHTNLRQIPEFNLNPGIHHQTSHERNLTGPCTKTPEFCPSATLGFSTCLSHQSFVMKAHSIFLSAI